MIPYVKTGLLFLQRRRARKEMRRTIVRRLPYSQASRATPGANRFRIEELSGRVQVANAQRENKSNAHLNMKFG